jgi:hypothetical protein
VGKLTSKPLCVLDGGDIISAYQDISLAAGQMSVLKIS